MKLIETKTGKKLEGEILQMRDGEIKKFKKHKDFSFDWSTEVKHGVYKIMLKEKETILGIVSVIDIPEELRMHINLIEASKEQRGKDKPIQNIVGCLIAYVCQMSYKKGYEGFVSLTPKTRLVKYYRESYGFQEMGNQMAVFYESSSSLITKYLDDEEI